MPNEHGRVGMAGSVYYQTPGQDPEKGTKGHRLRGSMQVESEEEAFIRSPPKPLGASWEPIELGWLATCSMLCIRNLEEPGGATIEMQGGGGPLDLWIPAGMTTVIYPRGIVLALRCPVGEAHYSLFAVPE